MDAGLIAVVALVALLAVALVALFRPQRPRKPDGVIHIMRRNPSGGWIDEPIGFYDPPKRARRRKPPTP